MFAVYQTLAPIRTDLDCALEPRCQRTKARIDQLSDRYLSLEMLDDRLYELSFHNETMQSRPWQPIRWNAIAPEQIVGIPVELFLAVIAVSSEVKPIPVYSRQAWENLPHITPQIAAFLGSKMDENGNVLEMGLWEREERQHSAIFRQIYEQIAGESLPLTTGDRTCFQADPDADRYLFKRVLAEWMNIAVYLWLMSHSIGPLHQAIAQLLQDEIGHLAKFWGILRLRWGDSPNQHWSGDLERLLQAFCSPQDPQNLPALRHLPLCSHLEETVRRDRDRAETNPTVNVFDDLASILQFSSYYSFEIGFVLLRSLRQIWRWNQHLHEDNLISLAIVSSEGCFKF